MKIEVQEVKSIEDGKHIGKIIDLEYRDQPYKYTDVLIELANGAKLKAGFPTLVNKDSKLGNLLIKFGATMEVGTSIDLESYLVGKACSFLTQSESTPRGTFAKIVTSSIKPVK